MSIITDVCAFVIYWLSRWRCCNRHNIPIWVNNALTTNTILKSPEVCLAFRNMRKYSSKIGAGVAVAWARRRASAETKRRCSGFSLTVRSRSCLPLTGTYFVLSFLLLDQDSSSGCIRYFRRRHFISSRAIHTKFDHCHD